MDYSDIWQMVSDILLFGRVTTAVDSFILLRDRVGINKFIMMNDLSSIDMNKIRTLAI